MRTTITVCDGCEQPISLQNETNGISHSIDLEFKTSITDPNTGMVEEVKTMKRRTSAVYCESCFQNLMQHMTNFLKDVGPSYTKVSQPSVTGFPKEIPEEAKKSQRAEKNFKAATGTILKKNKVEEKQHVSEH